MKNNNKVIKSNHPPEPSSSNFRLMVMRAAVARICQSVGFRVTSQSVLDIFTSIATEYLGALTQSAASFATLSGHPSPTFNLLNVVYALEDLSSNRGFAGASDVNRPLLSSSQLTDLIRFSKSIQKTKPSNPISILHQQQQQQQQPHQSSDCGLNLAENNNIYSHIPDWLPPIPDMKLLSHNGDKKRRNGDVLFGQITTTNKEDLDLFCGGSCDVGKRKLEATELPYNREKVSFKMRGKGAKKPRPPLRIMGINGVSCVHSSELSVNRIGLIGLKSRVGCIGRKIVGCQNFEKKEEDQQNNLQSIHPLQLNNSQLNSNRIVQYS